MFYEMSFNKSEQEYIWVKCFEIIQKLKNVLKIDRQTDGHAMAVEVSTEINFPLTSNPIGTSFVKYVL